MFHKLGKVHTVEIKKINSPTVRKVIALISTEDKTGRNFKGLSRPCTCPKGGQLYLGHTLKMYT